MAKATTMTVGVEQFREEVGRRMIDAYGLMLKLGLRNRSAIWKRVEAGKLPQPIYNRERTIALWDLDEVEACLAGEG